MNRKNKSEYNNKLEEKDNELNDIKKQLEEKFPIPNPHIIHIYFFKTYIYFMKYK